MDSPLRDRKTAATRARIADAALELFVERGYGDTSIDQIADAAGVGRRTVFRHFASKEAMLVDHLVVRRELAVQRLDERPADEPPLVSLHAVLRELSEAGYDRRMLAQIRSVLASEPGTLRAAVALNVQAFERSLVTVLARRAGSSSWADILAQTLMALSWLDAAIRSYLLDDRPSLVECFDEAVAACLSAGAADLAPAIAAQVSPPGSP